MVLRSLRIETRARARAVVVGTARRVQRRLCLPPRGELHQWPTSMRSAFWTTHGPAPARVSGLTRGRTRMGEMRVSNG
jgi:hypothetical protein